MDCGRACALAPYRMHGDSYILRKKHHKPVNHPQFFAGFY